MGEAAIPIGEVARRAGLSPQETPEPADRRRPEIDALIDRTGARA